MGFSFSAVDMPYLKAIMASNDAFEDVKWKVSKYSGDDEIRAINRLTEIGINHAKIDFFKM